jgi:hypothetical protein
LTTLIVEQADQIQYLAKLFRDSLDQTRIMASELSEDQKARKRMCLTYINNKRAWLEALAGGHEMSKAANHQFAAWDILGDVILGIEAGQGDDLIIDAHLNVDILDKRWRDLLRRGSVFRTRPIVDLSLTPAVNAPGVAATLAASRNHGEAIRQGASWRRALQKAQNESAAEFEEPSQPKPQQARTASNGTNLPANSTSRTTSQLRKAVQTTEQKDSTQVGESSKSGGSRWSYITEELVWIHAWVCAYRAGSIVIDPKWKIWWEQASVDFKDHFNKANPDKPDSGIKNIVQGMNNMDQFSGPPADEEFYKKKENYPSRSRSKSKAAAASRAGVADGVEASGESQDTRETETVQSVSSTTRKRTRVQVADEPQEGGEEQEDVIQEPKRRRGAKGVRFSAAHSSASTASASQSSGRAPVNPHFMKVKGGPRTRGERSMVYKIKSTHLHGEGSFDQVVTYFTPRTEAWKVANGYSFTVKAAAAEGTEGEEGDEHAGDAMEE